MINLQKTTFFRATNDALTLPKSSIEIIFAGRSNVGKSSVINALCRQKNLARTSKTPGRTRSVNAYSVNIGKYLIDIPGYGFARVSTAERIAWQTMMDDCIIKRQSKKTIFVIIDGFIGPTELDLTMLAWLKENKIDFKIIANKCDKMPRINKVKEIELYNEIAKKAAQVLKIDAENVFAISAKKQIGVEKLRKEIEKLLFKA